MLPMSFLLCVLLIFLMTLFEMSEKPIHHLAFLFGMIELLIGLVVYVNVYRESIVTVLVLAIEVGLISLVMLLLLRHYGRGLRFLIYLGGTLLILYFHLVI